MSLFSRLFGTGKTKEEPLDISVTSLLGQLRSADVGTAIAAALKINEKKDERFTRPLIKMLEETDSPQIIGACFRALKSSTNPDKIEPALKRIADLRPTYNDTGNPIGQLAFWALENVRDDRIPVKAMEVVDSLRGQVHFTFPCEVCIVAVRVLWNYPSPAVRTFLLGLLPLDGNTAAAAAEALRDYPDEEVVSALKSLAESPGLHIAVVEKARQSLAYMEMNDKKGQLFRRD